MGAGGYVEDRSFTRRQLFAVAVAAAGLPALMPALMPARAAVSAAAGDLERQVKAAFLYRFGGFVEWPPGSFARADSPLVIGCDGDDALAAVLASTVAGRTIAGRAVQAVRLGRDASSAHIVFVGSGNKPAARERLDGCRNRAVLTVSDDGDVHGMGSVINFLVVDARVRFEVSLAAAGVAGLQISARMLSAAYRVQQGGAE